VKLPVMAVYRQSETQAREIEQNVKEVGESLSFDCPPSLDGIKILVVDDDPDARQLLAAILRQCGAEVETCDSAARALLLFEEYKPDVLVSDIGMPEQDGYDLIRQIREKEKGSGKRLPAVALTAFARTEDRLKALSAGYNIHVPKPVEPAELLVVIANLTK
jgi:CheY-like chemotaxis protein